MLLEEKRAKRNEDLAALNAQVAQPQITNIEQKERNVMLAHNQPAPKPTGNSSFTMAKSIKQ